MATAVPALAVSASLQTLQNSTLSVPGASLAASGIPDATNLVGSNFTVSSVSPTTQRGGRAALAGFEQWMARYNDPGFNSSSDAYSIVARADGSVVVTGPSSTPETDSDFATVCYRADGVALWTNRYDGPAHGYDLSRSVATSPSGDVWVAGESGTRPPQQLSEVVLIKYSSNGVPVWTNRFGSYEGSACYPGTLLLDDYGNAYVTEFAVAWSASGSGTSVGDAISKFDPLGNVLWKKLYPSEAPDSGQGIHGPGPLATDDTGNLLIAGRTGGPHWTSGNAIVKFASDGTALWTNYQPRVTFGFFNAIAMDRDGNAILTFDGLAGDQKIYDIVKCSSSGALLWTNRVLGPGYQGGSVPRR